MRKAAPVIAVTLVILAVLAILPLAAGCTRQNTLKVSRAADNTVAGSNQSVLNDQDKARLRMFDEYNMNSEGLWLDFMEPKQPSKADFAVLSGATGVTWRQTGQRDLDMGKERAERAVRLLSSTILLGFGDPPPEAKIDYRLVFTGSGLSETVVVSMNAAYFRGKVYYRPSLSTWLGTNLHAN